MKSLIIIFTKNPVLGKVKTRLAKATGDELALKVYENLVNRTAHIVKETATDRAVFYSDFIPEKDIWNATFSFIQEGMDLGGRMKNAFKWAFNKKYDRVIIIGTDLWDITPFDIHNAFSALSKYDAVVGPSSDGGYYLLGLTQPIPNIFSHKEWSTDTVLNHTLKDLESYATHILSKKTDIDYYEDLLQFPDLMEVAGVPKI